ncbi:response regulator [Paenibacillus sp. IB182496]|uniref:Response regulator n=1 Tax=Paenibacillus sabuli TaxID=2772509 RepID=A0A927GQG0_9BACL|nr:response regulator [Paenibacillus sabuli]MBD2843855.1 response regulator [Paenibacillus sabuli]
MLNVLVIDDERSALDALLDEMNEFDEIAVAGAFTNIMEALEWIKEAHLRVDVVFLDIEMPGMNGLEAAQRIVELDASIDIVFITAYDQYALEAFEVSAVDYLLKPVMTERLAKTIRGRQLAHRRSDEERKSQRGSRLSITCFGIFQLRMGEIGTQIVKWRTNKTKELFAYFVHFREGELHKAHIIRDVFAELDEHRAYATLHTGVYYIRKMIRNYGLDSCMQLNYANDCYHFALSGVALDVEAYWRAVDRDKPVTLSNHRACARAAALYRGDYMGSSNYIWALPEQRKLRLSFLDLIRKLSAFYFAEGWLDKAVELLEEAATHSPLLEEGHEMLLDAYGKTGDFDALRRHFERMKGMFRQELGVEPGTAAEAVYRRWLE